MTPPDGAIDVAVNTDVVVTFSEPVNGIDSTTFILSAGGGVISSTVTVAGDRLSATLVPDADLASYTPHTVTVTTRVTDDASNPMAADFTSTFTTGTAPPPPDTTAPTVTGVAPAYGAVGVAVNTNVVVTFSEPVNGVDSTTFMLSVADVAIASTVTVAADRLSATLDPDAALANGTPYTVTVTSGVTDTSRNALDQDGDPANGNQNYTSSFTTEAATTETIEIIKATFSSRKVEFKVEATGTLGGPPATSLRARFSVDAGKNWSDFEAMTYATNKDKWSLIFSNVTTKPTNVQVCSTTTTTCVEKTYVGGGNRNGGGKKSK